MSEVEKKQNKNDELLQFEELMKEVSALPPELIRRFADIAQGIIMGYSMDKSTSIKMQ